VVEDVKRVQVSELFFFDDDAISFKEMVGFVGR
jgi:hypothetical protein